MDKKKITKNDIIASDIMYGIFAIIIALCFIAIAVVTVLVFVCCVIYLVKAFSTSNVALALGIDFLMLLCVALFVWLDIRIFISTKNSIKKYLNDRKVLLNSLNEE
ncbi:MAG: hypothetical protein MSH40_06200 [Christensenella sp.]|nr:hypothetical protein [Christensenella sp.]